MTPGEHATLKDGSQGSHAMTLEDFAKAANLAPYPTHPEGNLVVVTPSLAAAISALIETADEVVNESAGTPALLDALAAVRALHNYRRVRLGGKMNDRLLAAYLEYSGELARAGTIDESLTEILDNDRPVGERMADILRAAGRLPEGFDA